MFKTRTTKYLLIPITVLGLLSFLAPAYAFDYVIETTPNHSVYTMQSVPKPAKGSSIIDPNFHTTITRVTNVATDNSQHSYDFALGTYPMQSYSNMDDTFFVSHVHSPQDWVVYYGPASATPYQFLRTIPKMSVTNGQCGGANPNAPLWSQTDPNVLYFLENGYDQYRVNGSKLYSYNVVTNVITTLHDFTNDFPAYFTGANAICGGGIPSCNCTYHGYYVYWGEYSSQMSIRWLPLTIFKDDDQGGTAFTRAVIYDMATNSVYSSSTDATKLAIGSNKSDCTVSYGENYFVFRAARTNPDQPVCKLFDKDFNVIYSFNCNDGHRDMGRDVLGNPVWVGAGLAPSELSWLDLTDGTRYDTGTSVSNTALCCDQWGSCEAIHASAHNFSKPGWALISVESDVRDTGADWCKKQVFLVEMDKTKAARKIPYGGSTQNLSPSQYMRFWRLAHHHTYNPNNEFYNYAAFADISATGNYVYFKGAWENAGGEPIEVYQISLPSTWYQDLMGGDTTPPAAPQGLTVQ